MRAYLGGHAESRLAHVSFDHFDTLGDEVRVPIIQLLLQTIENRRLLEDFLETPLCGRRALPPDQKINLSDVRDLPQELRQPDLADKTGHADQQNILSCEGSENRKRFGRELAVENDQGAMICGLGALRGQYRLRKLFLVRGKPQVAQ